MAVDINGYPNLQTRTNAKGQRRRTTSRNDPIADEMEKANTPNEVAKLAGKYGINDDEITSRASTAPNFGQFRMVIGNRLRGIQKRLDDANKRGEKLTRADAAYPKKARKPDSPNKKAAKKVAKKVAKTATKRADGTNDPRQYVMTQAAVEKIGDGRPVEVIREYASLDAATKAMEKKGPGQFFVVHNNDTAETSDRFLLMTFKADPAGADAPAVEQVAKKVSKKVAKKTAKKATVKA